MAVRRRLLEPNGHRVLLEPGSIYYHLLEVSTDEAAAPFCTLEFQGNDRVLEHESERVLNAAALARVLEHESERVLESPFVDRVMESGECHGD